MTEPVPDSQVAEMELQPTVCAICGTAGNANVVYDAHLHEESLSPDIFSARRMPDRVHYRMVRCRVCGLLRSDPAGDPALHAALYSQAEFTYGDEVANLNQTYSRYLARAERHVDAPTSLLEIGCGNGFFLEEALRRGYTMVRGVEPTVSAVQQAGESVAPLIRCDIMRPGLFDAETFDVICLFQVFDHLPFPNAVLQECRRVLRPGGVLLALNHNERALSARVLGERSPIIDIEHNYLYSRETMRRIFARNRLEPCESGAVWNTYSSHYLARLLPLPARLKAVMLRGLQACGGRRIRVSVPLGNLYLVARKPRSQS